LNILAFIFIGLQIRPILDTLEIADRSRYFLTAGAVLVTVIVVRIAWHMSFNAVMRWSHRQFGFNPPRPLMRPTAGTGLVISWAGMRGIVSLAAAMALPPAFPYRNLIMLTAFAVVVGTLVVQGMTLKPLLRWLNLQDDDPVGRELLLARQRALEAGLASFADDESPIADLVRKEFTLLLADEQQRDRAAAVTAHKALHRVALDSARQALFRMRADAEIGDDAFHQLEEELDWLEMASNRQS
jgi:NhaP-type Na+/H+ or K+/H+ antiporter